MEVVSPPKASEPKSVHFAVTPPETIPRPDTPQEDEEGEMEGEMAVALYDFTGDANDELSVKEGETVLILDRSNDDWWKCRNHEGQEGVIPAQYLDLETSDGEQESRTAAAAAAKAPSPPPEDDSEEEREKAAEEERLTQERKERERQQKEKERERARAEREAAERKARAEEEERLAAERKRAEEKKARAAAAAQQQKVLREAEAQQKRDAEKRASKPR